MTQEEFNAIALENQVATDNYNNIKNRLNKINEVAQAYANATPEQQAKARWAMEQVLTEYNTLKQQQQDAFARLNTSSDNYTRALALMNQPAPAPTQTWAWQRRRTVKNQNIPTFQPLNQVLKSSATINPIGTNNALVGTWANVGTNLNINPYNALNYTTPTNTPSINDINSRFPNNSINTKPSFRAVEIQPGFSNATISSPNLATNAGDLTKNWYIVGGMWNIYTKDWMRMGNIYQNAQINNGGWRNINPYLTNGFY